MFGRRFFEKTVVIGAFCVGVGLSGCATVSGGKPPEGGEDVSRQVNDAVDKANRVYNAADRAYWIVENIRRWGRY